MARIVDLTRGKGYDKTAGSFWWDPEGICLIFENVMELKLIVAEPTWENVEIDTLPTPITKVPGKKELSQIQFDICLANDQDLESLYGAERDGDEIYFVPFHGADLRELAKKAYFKPMINGQTITTMKDWKMIPICGPIVASGEFIYGADKQRKYRGKAWAFPDPTRKNTEVVHGVNTPPAPTADFAGLPLTGTAPLEVTFTDLSTNEPWEWEWKIDSTIFSTKKNPVYTIAAAGTYDITLKVTNSAGTDTETKTDYIVVT